MWLAHPTNLEARILIADDLEADVLLLEQMLRGPATFASS